MHTRKSPMPRAGRPSIAIITICRNDLLGLQTTLASLLAQHRQPDEIRVIDGASTDGTVEWLSGLDQPAVQWQSERDSGIYDALNKGLKLVSSDLVLFTNAGDQLADPDVLVAIEADYLAHGWSWAFGNALVTSRGQVVGHHRLRRPRRMSFRAGAQSVPHQTVIGKRSLLAEVGEFRLDIGPSADQEHVLRLWLAAEPRYLDRTIALFDNSGVSSGHRPGDFALHSSEHRAMNGVTLLGNDRWDRFITVAVRHYRKIRSATRRSLTLARKPWNKVGTRAKGHIDT